MTAQMSREELKTRIERAMKDFTEGRASMHVPPLDTDIDMVLADCLTLLAGMDSEPVADDYFASLVTQARARADKAMRKFPQPNYVLNKVAEESGEVIKAVIHYTEGREEWRNVEGEIIDNLAMLIRLVQEGDQVIGFTPPTDCRAAMLKAGPVTAATVPDGWKLVPVEPTEAMLASAKECFGLTATAEGVYQKMIAAAPAAPEQEV